VVFSIKKSIKKILSILSGFGVIQKVLSKFVFVLQYLMGFGSGTDANSSGERAIFRVLEKKKSSYCIFDVGANKGQFLDLALRECATSCYKIHCFEPSLSTFEILLNRKKELSNVIFNNLGLGENNSEVRLYYNSEGSGLASLTKRRLDHFNIDFEKSEVVKIISLDFYCKQNNITHIDLLKIDVEGHELDVLRGASEMLKRNAIDAISFEFGGCNIDTKTYFQDFWYFFLDKNMKIYRITPSGYLSRVDSYTESCEQFRTTNYIALKK